MCFILKFNEAEKNTNPDSPQQKHRISAETNRRLADARKAAFNAYIKETGRKDLKTSAEIDEEILSDHFFDAAKRTGLLQSIAGKNRGLIERVVQWLKDTLNQFIEYFHNPQGKLTTTQAQAFASEFGRVCDKLVDENGKKIFRYNRRTGNIETRDRRRIESRTDFVDKQETFADNDYDLSQKVFDKYLTDGIMSMVRDTVGEEIGKYIDVSKMSDPVAREEARDKLPCIRQMLTWYNEASVQNREDYKNRLATRIEYARKCFDNDERIRNESIRQVNGNDRQGRKYTTGNETIPRNVTGRNNRDSGQSTRGVSSSVSGGKSGARKHFLELYNKVTMGERSNRRGVFSSARPSRYGRGVDDNRTDIPFDEKALEAEVAKAWREGTLKLSFAGVNAKTVDFKRLTTAQIMKSRGASSEEIFNETGWFKGKDGKLRFEIPDSRE